MKTPYKMKKSPINKGYAAKPSPFMQSKDDIIKAVISGDTIPTTTSTSSGGIHHDAPKIAGSQDKLNNDGGNITSGSTTENTNKDMIAKGSLQGYTIYKESSSDGLINRKNTKIKSSKVIKGAGKKALAKNISKKIGSRFIPGLGWALTAMDAIDFTKDLIETGSVKESGRRWLHGENTTGQIF